MHEAPNMGPIPLMKKHYVDVCIPAPQLTSAWRSLLRDMKCFHT